MLACSPFAAAQPTAATPDGETALYLTDSFNGSGLVAIDPETLEDVSPRPLLPIGWTSSNTFSTGASRDGRSIAVASYGGTGQGASEISVYDARTSALRARFRPEVPVAMGGLSADGSRIYAVSWPPRELGSERVTLDATTGRVMEREPAIALPGEVVTYVQDDERRRLYVVLVASDPNATGPRPIEIRAWDLRTGRELWRLPLPKALAGRWGTGRTIGDERVSAAIVPGFALSPDGREIALVQAGGALPPANLSHGTLSLVDAATGGPISERGFEVTTSVIERLFAVNIAAAKVPDEGVRLSATFSADGRMVHAWGTATQVPDQREPVERYLGMVSIRVSDARVTGTDIKMERGWYDDRLMWVRSSPGGRWLYVFLERRGEFADPKGLVLRRVDPQTLRVLAERGFDRYRQAFVLARP